MDLVSKWHVAVDDLAIDHTNDRRSCIIYYVIALGQNHYTGTTSIKLITEPSPSSGLMGVGIASTIVKNVRNDYNINSWSWLEADSPLDVLACLHCTVRPMPTTHFPSGWRI